MINGILQLLPIFALAILSAYVAYKMDVKHSFVHAVNKRFGFSENQSMMFFIVIMCVSMALVPFVLIVLLNQSRNLAYVIVSVIVGFCCYSAMDYKEILKDQNKMEAGQNEKI